jgi:adenylate cyclase
MVFFNDPVEIPEPVARALHMAVAIQQAVAKLASDWQRHGYQLQLGIGVARGYATIGGIGFEGRIDYGAVGTVTNLAARLCGEARGDEILVSQRVVAALPADIQVAPAGELTLKGFARPVAAFRVVARQIDESDVAAQ